MRNLTTSLLALSIFSIAFASSAFAQQPAMPNKNAPAEPPAMQGRDPLTNGGEGTIKMPKVYFISPKDGATVKPEFKAEFGVDGMKIANAGDMTPGTGHFHVIVDAPIVASEQMIPTDENHLHFGKGQKEAMLKLKPGPHTLTLEFADGAHRAYTPVVTQTIKITVK